MTYRPDDEPTFTGGRVIEGELVEPPLPGDELTERLEALSREIDEQPPPEQGAEISASLHALAGEAGSPPVGLEHAVIAGARRARRRRLAVTGIAALAVLTFSATAVTARSWGSDETDRLVATAPTADASPTTDPILAPPLVLPSSRVTPGAGPSASGSPSGSPVQGVPGAPPVSGAPVTGPAGPPGAPAPRPPASPGTTTKPAPPPAPLSVIVYVDDETPDVGQTVTFTFRWSDGDGRFGGTTAEWGDGQTGPGGDAAIDRCTQVPSPGSGTTSLSHVFDKAGTYKPKLSLSTYDCKTHRLSETVWLTPTVTVTAPPAPTGPPASPPTAEG